jgi:hypothetical protein
MGPLLLKFDLTQIENIKNREVGHLLKLMCSTRVLKGKNK